MIDLNKFAKEVHENARAHGWWDTERSFGEVIALIHSELSEALEEYRNGHAPTETYYYDGGKPEGIPSELADVVIRVLDWCGHEGITLDTVIIKSNCEITKKMIAENYKFPAFANGIAASHSDISFWYNDEVNIEAVISGIFCMSTYYGIDLESALLEKHNFNKTRPYKHGGKVI